MQESIDFLSLLPNISSLWSLPSFSEITGEQLSAIWVLSLIAIAFYFYLRGRWNYSASSSKIKKLNKLLKNETQESVLSNRQDLLEKAGKEDKVIGHLWSEFDESLLPQKKENKLCNTLDASHFFNTSTLAANVTENRLLASIPALLTGLGVLGTFVGLQLGLSGLNIGNDVAVEEMKSGLAEVISGAKIAFLTSAWGVFLSLIFNFIEKRWERSLRKKISRLQHNIDHLFSRLTPESQLYEIAKNSSQSKEDLKYFAEQIGNNLQTTVRDFGDRINETIGGLAEGAGNANQVALDSLIQRFLDEFGAVGGQQAEEMKQANERFAAALNSLDSSMTMLLKQLEESQKNGAKREQELVEKISAQVDQLVINSKKQQDLLADTIDKKLSELLNQFDKHNLSAGEREEARNTSVNELLKRLETGMDAQLSASQKLIGQGESLQESIRASIQGNIEAGTRLQACAGELNEASQHMKSTGRLIEQAGQHISSVSSKAVDSTHELARENQNVVSALNSQQKLLSEQQQRFNDSITQMESMFGTAEQTFEELDKKQQQFIGSFAQHINELSSSMTNMLEDYSSQLDASTEERLKVWVNSTTQYTTAMQEAIESLNSVVDEIQDKVSR